MPFDATPAEIPFEVRTLPDRRTALRNLAWLLRNRKHWPAGFKWDYWHEESCAIELCRKYYGDDVYNVIASNRGAVQQPPGGGQPTRWEPISIRGQDAAG